MAFDQASYVLSLPKMPEEGAIHIGKFGETPPVRAHLPQYNWPAYGRAQNTAIGEIAYTGFNGVAAQSFWENSPIHKRTALNPAYREIGAAAMSQRWGHFYFVDFGSRPDVLPAIADTSDHTLYLTNERYTCARSPWILNVLKVRLFDSDGNRSIPTGKHGSRNCLCPLNVGDELYVGYLDANGVMVLAPVSLDNRLRRRCPPIHRHQLTTMTASATLTPTLATTAKCDIACTRLLNRWRRAWPDASVTTNEATSATRACQPKHRRPSPQRRDAKRPADI